MDFERARSFIVDHWWREVAPTLERYIAVPCVSPAFEPDWAARGHMEEAAAMLADWARDHLSLIPGVSVEIQRLDGRTPLLFIEVAGPGTSRDETVLIYGHLDKQPEMAGWSEGRGPWTPVLEGDRLYGRGGADDGYALFSAVLALRALYTQNLPIPRTIILIEACEESSSEDLPFYIDALAGRIGTPSLVVALDSMCGNYEQLWATTSLRGQVAGTLTVRVLSEGMHSGEVSGIVPSSFRIATQLLSRLEDPATGEIIIPQFAADIPQTRIDEARSAAAVLGRKAYEEMPFVKGAMPTSKDVARLLVERSWKPQLAITGLDGLPAVKDAAAVMQPSTALKLSLRLPPTVSPDHAADRLKSILEQDPPYGAAVTFDVAFTSPGWHAPETAQWLAKSLDDASLSAFGKPHVRYGGGGGIPFLNMLGERFPSAQFVVTGVLGPQSNAHGPNEFLHIPTALNVTAALASIVHSAALQAAEPARAIA